MEGAPSTEEWRALYAAAAKCWELRGWCWMSDILFGVQDPDDSERYYCMFLESESGYGTLLASRGSRGLGGLDMLIAGDFPEPQDAFFFHDLLVVSFTDREHLTKRDHDVVRHIGIRIHGRGRWPKFRDLTPGHIPWYISSSQAITLTRLLDQASEVVLEELGEGTVTDALSSRRMLLRRIERQDGEGSWGSIMVSMPVAEVDIILPDAEMVQKLRKKVKESGKRGGPWEVSFFHMGPDIKRVKERTSLLRAVSIVDHRSGRPIVLGKMWVDDVIDIADELIGCLLEADAVPSSILVQDPWLGGVIGATAEAAGVRLFLRSSLPRTERAWADLMDDIARERKQKKRKLRGQGP
jgi:hypothetical protein